MVKTLSRVILGLCYLELVLKLLSFSTLGEVVSIFFSKIKLFKCQNIKLKKKMSCCPTTIRFGKKTNLQKNMVEFR